MAPTLLGNIKTFINQCLPDYIINSWSSTAQTGKAPSESLVKTALNNKSDVGHTHNYASISDIDVEIEAYLDAIIDALEEADIIGGAGGSSIDISTQWSTPLSDSKVPSEKLVKESLDTKADSSSIPSASTSTPAKDTTNGTYGSGTAYARANHAHPKSNIYAEAEHEHDTDDIGGLIDLIYPVGSIYINMVDQTSPATKFPGTTWDRITNRFIYGCADGEAGMTGGEATHTLTTNEMPSHNHQEHEWNIIVSAGSNTGQYTPNYSGDNWCVARDDRDWQTVRFTGSKGGGAAHNNMPPYVKAYMWVRVS